MISISEAITILKGNKAVDVFDEPQSGTFPYLQIEDLRPDANPKYARDDKGVLVTEKDVLIAWDGANAGTVGFGLTGYAGSTIAILRPKRDDIYAPYLGYFLRSKFDEIQANTTGATIPHISRDYLENLRCPFPPLSEQRRVAALLGKADRLRRLRRYAMQLGETFLHSVFMRMFYKSSTNWPQLNICSLAKSARNSIRTGPFGSQLLHSEFTDKGDVTVLGIDNVVHNYFSWGKPRHITHERYQQLKRYTVFPGDLLISIMATTGRCAVVPDNIPLAINTKHLCCISFDQKKCLPIYLQYCLLYHPSVIRQMGGSMRGAIMPGLNMEIIKSLVVPLPQMSLQQRFVRVVEKYGRLRGMQREAERQAEDLFQALLDKSFGEEF